MVVEIGVPSQMVLSASTRAAENKRSKEVTAHCTQCHAIAKSSGVRCRNLAQCHVNDTRLSASLCNVHAEEYRKNGSKNLRFVPEKRKEEAAPKEATTIDDTKADMVLDRKLLLSIAASLQNIDTRLTTMESSSWSKPTVVAASTITPKTEQPTYVVKQEPRYGQESEPVPETTEAAKTENEAIDAFARIEAQQPIAEQLEVAARIVTAEIATVQSLVQRWCGKEPKRADQVAQPVYAYRKRLDDLLSQARKEALTETPNLTRFAADTTRLMREFERDANRVRAELGQLCATKTRVFAGVPIAFQLQLARGQIRCNNRAIPKSMRDWVLRGDSPESKEWSDRKLLCLLRDRTAESAQRKSQLAQMSSADEEEAADDDENNNEEEKEEKEERIEEVGDAPLRTGQKLANNYEVYRARTDVAAIGKRVKRKDDNEDSQPDIINTADDFGFISMPEAQGIANDMAANSKLDSELALQTYLEWLQTLTTLIDLKMSLGADPSALILEKTAVSAQIVTTALALGKDVARQYLSDALFQKLANDARLVASYAQYLQEPLGVAGLATLVAYDTYNRYRGLVDEVTLRNVSRAAFLNALPNLALIGGSLLGAAVWLNIAAQPKTPNTESSPIPDKVPVLTSGKNATEAVQKAIVFRPGIDYIDECGWFGSCGSTGTLDRLPQPDSVDWNLVSTFPRQYADNLVTSDNSTSLARVLTLGRTPSEQARHSGAQMRSTARALQVTDAGNSSSVAAVQLLPQAIASPGYVQHFPRTRAEWLAALAPSDNSSTTLPLLSPKSAEMLDIFRDVVAARERNNKSSAASERRRERLEARTRQQRQQDRAQRAGNVIQQMALPQGTLPAQQLRLGPSGSVSGPVPDTVIGGSAAAGALSSNTDLLGLIPQIVLGADIPAPLPVNDVQFLQREQSAFLDVFAPENAPFSQEQQRLAPNPFATPLDNAQTTELEFRRGLTLARQFQLQQALLGTNETLREPERAAQVRFAVERANGALADDPTSYFDFATPGVEQAADFSDGLPLQSSAIGGILRTVSGEGLGTVTATDVATTQSVFDPLLFDAMGGNKTAIDQMLRRDFSALDVLGSPARAAARDAATLLRLVPDLGQVSATIQQQIEKATPELLRLFDNAASLHGFLVARYEILQQQVAKQSRRVVGGIARGALRTGVGAGRQARETLLEAAPKTLEEFRSTTMAPLFDESTVAAIEQRSEAAISSAEQTLRPALQRTSEFVQTQSAALGSAASDAATSLVENVWEPTRDAVRASVRSTSETIADQTRKAYDRASDLLATATQETLPAVQRSITNELLPALRSALERQLDRTEREIARVTDLAVDQLQRNVLPATQRAVTQQILPALKSGGERAIAALRSQMQVEILPEVRAQLERSYGTLQAEIDQQVARKKMSQLSTITAASVEQQHKERWTKQQFRQNERLAYERALAAQSEKDQTASRQRGAFDSALNAQLEKDERAQQARNRRQMRRYMAEQRRALVLAAYVAPNSDLTTSQSAEPTVAELVAKAEVEAGVASEAVQDATVNQPPETVAAEMQKQTEIVADAYNDAIAKSGSDASQQQIAVEVAPHVAASGWQFIQWQTCMSRKATDDTDILSIITGGLKPSTDVQVYVDLAKGLACGAELDIGSADVEEWVNVHIQQQKDEESAAESKWFPSIWGFDLGSSSGDENVANQNNNGASKVTDLAAPGETVVKEPVYVYNSAQHRK